MTPVENILEKLSGVKETKSGWMARCPAHEDRKASLSIAEGEDGKALVKYYAGCPTQAVLAAIGKKMADLSPKRGAQARRNVKAKAGDKTFLTASDALTELELRHGKPSSVWTYHNAQGEPVGLVVRWDKPDGKDIRPVAWHKDGWRIGAMPEPRPLYDLPNVIKAKSVLVCEGEKAADAARSLGFTATTSAGGSQAAGKTDWGPVAGKEVRIFPDNDRAGGQYSETVASIAAKLTPAPVIRIVVLPGLPPKGDMVDWINAHGEAAEPIRMRAEIEALAKAVEPRQVTAEKAAENAKPEIIIGTDEHRVNAEAVAALAQDAQLFQRGGMLVQIIKVQEDAQAAIIRRPDPMPVIRNVPNPLLREYLSRDAHWLKRIKGENADLVPCHPPDWSVAAVGARHYWPGVRRLEAIVSHPVIMPDGTILASNGYDLNSRLFVCISRGLKISVPDRPTRDDVKVAIAVLSDVIADFPFVKDAHRAAWFAGLFTPLAWISFSGPAPLFLIDANIRAAGKGLLADVIALIVTGLCFAVMSYTPDREELRKRITTLAVEGDRMVLLDNLADEVGNDVLDAALTADIWKDRLLGGNRVFNGPLNICWYGTGNNVQLVGDTPRRVCHIRMESQEEHPELRSGFRYPDLRAHVRANRGLLLSAALTILRAWFVAGKPTTGLIPWGTFDGWSNVVRACIVWAGLPDPGETRFPLLSTSNRDAQAMAAMIDALAKMDPEHRGKTTGEIIEAIYKPGDPAPEWLPDLRSAVEELCDKPDSRKLGYLFRSIARRNFNGRMIDRATSVSSSNSVRWVVCDVKSAKQPEPSPVSAASPGGANE